MSQTVSFYLIVTTMTFKSEEKVERKILSILKVLSNLQEPAGSRIISKHLKEHGVELSERGVRYHLRLTDQRGLTQLVRDRDGRVITEKGLQEIDTALVGDKVGFAISRIELLAFRTDFDIENQCGLIPVNISFFAESKFAEALRAMKPAFEKNICVSQMVSVAAAGQRMGNIVVPEGNIGLATVCSIVINGALLKAGIPMDSRFGGLLQVRDGKPIRFTQVIHYNGSSLDPSEIFIKAKMTSVREAALHGDGEILANFREVPAICRPIVEKVIEGLNRAGINGVLVIGNTSEPVCEVEVDLNKIGIILLGGLNPVSAVSEIGFDADNHSMSTVMRYSDLVSYKEVLSKY